MGNCIQLLLRFFQADPRPQTRDRFETALVVFRRTRTKRHPEREERPVNLEVRPHDSDDRYATPSSRTDRPMMPGSPWKCLRHNRSLRIVTGGAEARGQSG
jgi:hypothetical protein